LKLKSNVPSFYSRFIPLSFVVSPPTRSAYQSKVPYPIPTSASIVVLLSVDPFILLLLFWGCAIISSKSKRKRLQYQSKSKSFGPSPHGWHGQWLAECSHLVESALSLNMKDPTHVLNFQPHLRKCKKRIYRNYRHGDTPTSEFTPQLTPQRKHEYPYNTWDGDIVSERDRGSQETLTSRDDACEAINVSEEMSENLGFHDTEWYETVAFHDRGKLQS